MSSSSKYARCDFPARQRAVLGRDHPTHSAKQEQMRQTIRDVHPCATSATCSGMTEKLFDRILIKRRIPSRDVLHPFRRDAGVVDHQSGSVAIRPERKTNGGV